MKGGLHPAMPLAAQRCRRLARLTSRLVRRCHTRRTRPHSLTLSFPGIRNAHCIRRARDTAGQSAPFHFSDSLSPDSSASSKPRLPQRLIFLHPPPARTPGRLARRCLCHPVPEPLICGAISHSSPCEFTYCAACEPPSQETTAIAYSTELQSIPLAFDSGANARPRHPRARFSEAATSPPLSTASGAPATCIYADPHQVH